MIKDFKEFLLKQNALALAIGVIIGAAIGKVVSSIAEDVINPVIGLLMPGGDWRGAKIVLAHGVDAAERPTVTRSLLPRFSSGVSPLLSRRRSRPERRTRLTSTARRRRSSRPCPASGPPRRRRSSPEGRFPPFRTCREPGFRPRRSTS